MAKRKAEIKARKGRGKKPTFERYKVKQTSPLTIGSPKSPLTGSHKPRSKKSPGHNKMAQKHLIKPAGAGFGLQFKRTKANGLMKKGLRDRQGKYFDKDIKAYYKMI